MSKQSGTSTRTFPSPAWLFSPSLTAASSSLYVGASYSFFPALFSILCLSASSRLLPSLCGRLIIWVNALCLAELFPVKAPSLHWQYNYEGHENLMNMLDKYRRWGRQLRGWHLLWEWQNQSSKKKRKCILWCLHTESNPLTFPVAPPWGWDLWL